MIAFEDYIKMKIYPISLKKYEYVGVFYNKYKEYLFDEYLAKKIDSYNKYFKNQGLKFQNKLIKTLKNFT